VLVARGAMSLGDLVAFLLYATYLIMPLSEIIGALSAIQRGLGALTRVEAVFTFPREPNGTRQAGRRRRARRRGRRQSRRRAARTGVSRAAARRAGRRVPRRVVRVRRRPPGAARGVVHCAAPWPDRAGRPADRIVVLDEGQVVATGAPEDLLRTCDLYRRLAAIGLDAETVATPPG
jgi:ABC-type multidrug transport system fused ATPase/permease subunit